MMGDPRPTVPDQDAESLEALHARKEAAYGVVEVVWREEKEANAAAMDSLAERGGFAVAKRNLVSAGEQGIEMQAEDEIEFRAEQGGSGVTIWQVRNKRIAEHPDIKEYPGMVAEATLEEAQAFIDRMEAIPFDQEGVGNIGGLKSVLYYKRKSDPGYAAYRMYVVKDAGGRVVGAGYAHGAEGRDTYLEGLSIDPAVQGQGAGTAFMSEMKRRYSSISLKPIPKSRTERLTHDQLEAMLKAFYKKNGFVCAKAWAKERISLMDETAAGEWREIDFNDRQMALDNEVFWPVDVFAAIFEHMVTDAELQAKFPPEVIARARTAVEKRRIRLQAIAEFEEVNQAYIAKMREISPDTQ